jgi:hypothetical protein
MKYIYKLAVSIVTGFILLALSACNLPEGTPKSDVKMAATPMADAPTQTASAVPSSSTPTPSETPIPPTSTSSSTPTETSTPSETPTPTETFTPTITPTYAVLRGKVIPERANCRYGPGAPYLYKYGLVGGSNLEIIGRTDRGTWILIQAIGGNNPCWVKADLMEIKGDVMALEQVAVDIVQGWSPYYAPLTGVSASRDGDKVTVFWHPLILRAGDDAEQVPYVLEAWVCQDGDFIFVPVGAYVTAAEVIDEPGCEQESWGQVLGAEKHGYTWPVKVVWP